MKTKLNPFFYLCCVFFLLLACQKSKKADAIWYNGRIYSANAADEVLEAMAISGDRILMAGQLDEMNGLIGPHTKMHDLGGAFVMPGLIEGHGHFIGLGESLSELNLIQSKSWSDIVDQTKAAVAKSQPGQWIEGRGWHQEKWKDEAELKYNGYPYHDALSAVSPDNPVILIHASGHALMANKRAMDLAGVTVESKSPPGGRIVTDPNGNRTGVFEENAMQMIQQAFQKEESGRTKEDRLDEFRKHALLASQACIQQGITSFQDAGSSIDEIHLLKNLCDSGVLQTRLWVMLYQDPKQIAAQIQKLPVKHNAMTNFCAIAVKAYVDGALGSYGAWMLEDYEDKPEHFGQNTMSIADLDAIAGLCIDRNLQLCVHGIGDRANREILNVFEKHFSSNGPADYRWRIEHAQHLDPDDIPRFKQLGVIASMQAVHCTSDAPFVEKRLGEQRSREGAYAWRALIDSGAKLANGTDCPVESVNPFECLYAAITRRRLDNGFEFFSEQKMTRIEALRSYTIWNAYAAKEENLKGSLEPGKLADFVILDRNLLSCADEELAKTKVIKVFIGGKEIIVK